MIAPTFLKVGDAKQYSLAELKVTGYTPADQDGGCYGGDIIIHQLNASGYYEDAMYYWIDDGYTAGAKAGWYADLDGTPIPGGAESVSIPAGKGLWILQGMDTDPNYKYRVVIPGVEIK